MRKNKVKGSIYFRNLFTFLVIYLILMAGFSLFSISQENKMESYKFRTMVPNVSSHMWETRLNDIDIEQAGDIPELALVAASIFPYYKTELAIFTDDFNLVSKTSENWLCQYPKSIEMNKYTANYAYLDPKDWFNEEEIKELEDYLYHDQKPKRVGDLAGYSIDLNGFWLDNGMVVPEEIRVITMFAREFDEQGNLIGSSSRGKESTIYTYKGNVKNTEGLPYFERGTISTINSDKWDQEIRRGLRNLVTDGEKLKEIIGKWETGDASFADASIERVNLYTYRYYYPVPYQNKFEILEDKTWHSDYWAFFATEVSLLENIAPNLIFVGISTLILFLVVALILSERTFRLYKKREELDNHRRQMTNALAHDLKTPLSIISGYAQNLMENIHTEKREYYAANIQTKVNQMDKIILEMLELSKLEADTFQIAFEKVSLDQLCKKIIDRYSQICNEKSITVHLEGEQIIQADRSLMEKVIDNFFTNALNNTPDGGAIRIRLSDDILEFYNSGSHIPEDKIKEIWEPYKKIDESRSETKGTGLGLSIVRTILELHKFPYGVRSSGEGVTFWFRFI